MSTSWATADTPRAAVDSSPAPPMGRGCKALQAVTVAEGLPAFVAGAAGAPGLAGNPPAWRPGQALLDPDGDLCGAGGGIINEIGQ